MNLNPVTMLNSISNSTQSQQSGRQATDKHPITSGWGDDLNVRKIGVITSSIPRNECPLLNFRLSSNIEIWQGRGFCAAAATVFKKRLSRKPTGAIRQRQPLKDCRIKPPIQISGTWKSRGQFRIDNRVDENRAVRCGQAKLVFRPREPDRVRGRNVQQHVRVEKIHPSSRVRAITFPVVSPGQAAPRARCSQPSTGAGVARLTRKASSQTASSSTCGLGSFSMASSISTMPLISIL